MEIRQLGRGPLDIIARGRTFPTDMIAVDGSLIPVDMEDHVPKRGRPGRRQRLADPAGGHPPLPFDDVNPRRLFSIVIHRAQSQADGTPQTDAGCSGRKTHKRCRRGRMAVQDFGAELLEKGRFRNGIPSETEQVLQADPEAILPGQKLGRRNSERFVPQGPKRIEAHGLVAGCK